MIVVAVTNGDEVMMMMTVMQTNDDYDAYSSFNHDRITRVRAVVPER